MLLFALVKRFGVSVCRVFKGRSGFGSLSEAGKGQGIGNGKGSGKGYGKRNGNGKKKGTGKGGEGELEGECYGLFSLQLAYALDGGRCSLLSCYFFCLCSFSHSCYM